MSPGAAAWPEKLAVLVWALDRGETISLMSPVRRAKEQGCRPVSRKMAKSGLMLISGIRGNKGVRTPQNPKCPPKPTYLLHPQHLFLVLFFVHCSFPLLPGSADGQWRRGTLPAWRSSQPSHDLILRPCPLCLQVHHIDSAVVMLVDILAAGIAPISSPLPLAVPLAETAALEDGPEQVSGRPPSGGGEAAVVWAGDRAAAREPAAPRSDHQQDAAPPLPLSTSSGQPPAAAARTGPGAAAYALHYPAWLVDGAAGLVYRLQLDLRAIAESQSSDCPRLLAFLQRRRASPAPRRDATGITLRVLRGLMQDEAPMPLLRRCFDVVNSFAETANRQQQRGNGSSTSSAASSGRASPLPPGVGAGAAAGASLPSPSFADTAAALQQMLPVVTPQVRLCCCCCCCCVRCCFLKNAALLLCIFCCL